MLFALTICVRTNDLIQIILQLHYGEIIALHVAAMTSPRQEKHSHWKEISC